MNLISIVWCVFVAGNASDKQKMSVNDFDLLALVGKGSFGKVKKKIKKKFFFLFQFFNVVFDN